MRRRGGRRRLHPDRGLGARRNVDLAGPRAYSDCADASAGSCPGTLFAPRAYAASRTFIAPGALAPSGLVAVCARADTERSGSGGPVHTAGRRYVLGDTRSIRGRA